MDISIVIPAYNEEKRIGGTLQSVVDYIHLEKLHVEIIVVDDGSKDATVDISRKYASKNPQINFKVIILNKNMGKGAAVRAGMLASEGAYILFMDADSSTPITELPKLLNYKDDNHIVIGSRYLNESLIHEKAPWYRQAITGYGKHIVNQVLLFPLSDTQCGFKIFKREIGQELAREQRTNRFGFDVELLARAQRKKYTIKEVPVTWSHSYDSRFRPVRDSLKTFIEIMAIKKLFMQEEYKKAMRKKKPISNKTD